MGRSFPVQSGAGCSKERERRTFVPLLKRDRDGRERAVCRPGPEYKSVEGLMWYNYWTNSLGEAKSRL
jgi:hypothetical protein